MQTSKCHPPQSAYTPLRLVYPRVSTKPAARKKILYYCRKAFVREKEREAGNLRLKELSYRHPNSFSNFNVEVLKYE